MTAPHPDDIKYFERNFDLTYKDAKRILRKGVHQLHTVNLGSNWVDIRRILYDEHGLVSERDYFIRRWMEPVTIVPGEEGWAYRYRFHFVDKEMATMMKLELG